MINFQEFRRPRLRVVILTHSLSPGGAERWVVTLCKSFQAFKVTALIDLSGQNGELRNEVPRDIPILSVNASLTFEKALAKALSLGCDIILGWGSIHFDMESLPVPVVLCSHSTLTVVEPPKANYLAAVNEASVNYWPEDVRDRVRIIYNGVSLDRLDPLYDPDVQYKHWGITDPSAKVMLFMGRFSQEKNAEAVIRAAQHLPDNWVCVMMGWGPQSKYLIEDLAPSCARSSKMTGRSNILFPKPSFDSVGSVLRAADCLVIPSHREAFPLVMVEAWLTHCPVVMSSLPILDELNETFGAEYVTRVPIKPTPEQIALAVQIPPNQKMLEDANTLASRYLTAAAMTRRWEDYLYSCVLEWQQSSFSGEVQYAPSPRTPGDSEKKTAPPPL